MLLAVARMAYMVSVVTGELQKSSVYIWGCEERRVQNGLFHFWLAVIDLSADAQWHVKPWHLYSKCSVTVQSMIVLGD